MVAVLGTLKLKIRPEREGGFMATQKRRSSEEDQKSREGGKTKTNFKTLAEENATSARTTGRQSQTITTLK